MAAQDDLRLPYALKAFRRRFDLKQSQLADIVGVRENTVGSWERGRSYPTWRELDRMRSYALERDPKWSTDFLFEPDRRFAYELARLDSTR